MACRRQEGATLIELAMVIMIIVIIVPIGAYLVMYAMQNSVFTINKLNADMAAKDALNIMVEGDALAKGLRFCRSISSINSDQLNFVNQDNQTITYRRDTVSNKLYRSVNGGTSAFIPYYAQGVVSIFGLSSKLFTYYDANNLETSNAASVRLIKVGLIARIGAGAYYNWEAESQQLSSIAVNKFQ